MLIKLFKLILLDSSHPQTTTVPTPTGEKLQTACERRVTQPLMLPCLVECVWTRSAAPLLFYALEIVFITGISGLGLRRVLLRVYNATR